MRRILLGAALLLAAGAAQAQETFKIGVVGDQTGGNAETTGPGAVVAARMAVEDFGGTVLGRPIEIVVGDFQNKADVAAGIVREWIDAEGVEAIADGATSGSAIAIQQIVDERNKVFLNTSGSSTDLTGKLCTATASQWLPDTYSVSHTVADTITKDGGDSWFFITVDYAFGYSIEGHAGDAVKAAGGEVLGAVRHPFQSLDFSSYVLQAQASGAKVVGLANTGTDVENSIKQINEFGLLQQGTQMAALQFFITNVVGLGLDLSQGLKFMTSVYWDENDETRAWTKRFMAMHKEIPPSRTQVSTYSAVLHYLRAVEAAGTTDGKVVMAKMKQMPVDDIWFKGATIREDGRVMVDMLLVQVKSPEESSAPFDYLRILKRVPAQEAFLPLEKSECPLVKKQ